MNGILNPARRSLLAVIAGVVVLVGLVAWVSSIGGPHGPGAGLASVLYVLMQAGAPAAAYLLGAIGLGSLFAPLWRGARDGVALQCGVGLAVMLSLSHGLGVLCLLAGSKGLVLGGGVVVVGMFLLSRQVLRHARASGGRVAGTLPWSVLLGLPGLALLLVAACSPPGWLWGGTRADPVGEARGYDALEYHLELPQEWLRDGRIWPRDWNVYSYLPGYVESAFTHLGVLTRAGPGGLTEGEGFGVVSCQLLVAMMGVLAAFLVGRMVSGFFSEAVEAHERGLVAGIAGVLFLSTPWVMVTGSLAYNEMGMVGLMAAALVAAGDRGLVGWRRGVLSGLLVGVACGCKPTALFLCAPVVGVVLISCTGVGREKKPQMSQMSPDGKKREEKPQMGADGRGGEETKPQIAQMNTDEEGKRNSVWGYLGHLWMPLLAAAGAGVLAILPWLIRNWVACGNPVFPMGAGVFGSGSWSAEQMARYGAGHHFVGAIGERVGMLFSSERGALHLQWGVLPVAAVVGLVVGLVRKRTRVVAAALGVGMAMQVLAWMFLTHLQSRFLMPVGVTGCGLVGVGLWAVMGGAPAAERRGTSGARSSEDRSPWQGMRRGIVVGAGALVCMAQVGLSVGQFSVQGDGKPNLLILESPWVFTGELERRALAADPSRATQLAEQASPEVFVNVLTPPGVKVYLLGEARALYYTRPVLYNTTYDKWPLGEAMRRSPGKAAAWTRELWDQGVRLVLVNESEIERLQKSGWADPLVTVEAVRGWLKDEGRLVRSWPQGGPGGVGLYELKRPG